MRPRNAIWREVTESCSYYVPMAEVFWHMGRSRMLIFCLQEVRPCGQTPQVYEQMRVKSLAEDVNNNRSEFAQAQTKKHGTSAFGDTSVDLAFTSFTVYHCKINTSELPI